MENKTNKIIILDDDKKYIIVNQIGYKGKIYYLANEITPDEEDLTDNVFLLEESNEGDKTFVQIVTDQTIVETILNALQNQ